MDTEWKYFGFHDYEREQPGLGVSHKYVNSMGWIDLYIYTLNRNDWKNGTSDEYFDEHFKSVVQAITAAERTGPHRNVMIHGVDDIEINGQPFRHAKATFILRGENLESHVFVTGLDGRIIKYRMSFKIPISDNIQDVMIQFITMSIERIKQRKELS